ncbi:MAG TPA: carbon storage regulator CsrA [Candidatus Rubrimentiphilum sp.]|nr:carbon storage regulator CsrA [Candidatus Rubrimentiphilum sp.]
MLVLTRKVNQSIAIGDDVRIVVVAIEGDQVRLGIEAPREVAVDRSEVREKS